MRWANDKQNCYENMLWCGNKNSVFSFFSFPSCRGALHSLSTRIGTTAHSLSSYASSEALIITAVPTARGATAQQQKIQQRPLHNPMISQIHQRMFPSSFLAHDCVWARLLWFFEKEAETSTPPPRDLWLPWNKCLTPSIVFVSAGGVLILASTMPFGRHDKDRRSPRNSIEMKDRMFLSALVGFELSRVQGLACLENVIKSRWSLASCDDEYIGYIFLVKLYSIHSEFVHSIDNLKLTVIAVVWIFIALSPQHIQTWTNHTSVQQPLNLVQTRARRFIHDWCHFGIEHNSFVGKDSTMAVTPWKMHCFLPWNSRFRSWITRREIRFCITGLNSIRLLVVLLLLLLLVLLTVRC